MCEIILPRLTQRRVLEETEGLAPRRSRLGKAMGVLDPVPAGDASDDGGSDRGERYMSRSPSRSPSPEVHFERAESFYTEGSEDESDAEAGAGASGGGRGRGRSASVAGSDGRFVSRSPSPGSDAGGAGVRYVSRSPTRSPELAEGMQVDA